MTKQLKKRPIEQELKFLADFEIYGVLMFWMLYFATKYIIDMDFGSKAFKLNWTSFYPLLVFSVIVIEGSFYWRNKLNRIKRKKALSNMQIGGIYHKLRWINVILLTACLPVIMRAVLAKENLAGIVVGILFGFLAVIEQINYFHIRLSYETVNGGLLIVEPVRKIVTGTGRRSALRKDIDAYCQYAGE